MKRVRKTLKKYFVPHEENDHKPQLLRPQTVAFVLIIAIAMESILLFGTSYLAPHSRLFGIVVANTLVDETNQNRVANAEQALTVSPLLQVAAQEKADDMVTDNYFAHTSPAGLTPWYWFEQVGYSFTYAGENLAVNFSDSQDVTNAWMNSPEHRANILNGNFTNIGIATAQGTFQGHPAVYVVELFGAPASAMPSLSLINTASAASIPVTSPVTATATTSKPIVKTSVAKPVVQTTTAPTVMVSTSLETATSDQTFVEIQGAEAQTVPASGTILGTKTSSTGAEPKTPAPTANIASQSNPVQDAAANPRQIINYIYLAIIALFALALGINIFVKIKIQHPQIIFGGMLVILVVGFLIVLNQHALAGTVIL